MKFYLRLINKKNNIVRYVGWYGSLCLDYDVSFKSSDLRKLAPYIVKYRKEWNIQVLDEDGVLVQKY